MDIIKMFNQYHIIKTIADTNYHSRLVNFFRKKKYFGTRKKIKVFKN